MRKRRRWSGGIAIGCVVGLVLACAIRQDEFVCEDAAAHLEACCQGFHASNIDCTYQASQGCNDSTVYPEIDVPQSACIRAETCDQLKSTGVCTRAIALPTASQWALTQSAPDSGSTSQGPAVCP
jgi:hypothetical protein